MRWRTENAPLFVLLFLCGGELVLSQQRAAAPFAVEETTIAQIHAAMRARQLTCRALVDAYLKRIDTYDKRGPALNAIVVINSNAAREADDLDRRFAQSGPVGPLHCIPAIVKDNFETTGLQSADGSLSLKGFVSNKDAFLVRRIKAAGAIVLAKSNMAEFAFSPYETVSSILPGYNAIRTRSIASRPARAAGRPQQSPRISARSDSAPTPAIPSAVLRRTRPSPASVRRWD